MTRKCPQCGTAYEDTIAFCGNDGAVTVQVQPEGETADTRLGRRFGEYVVAARVADGAMGRVYEGRHATTRQKVAIKILHEDVAKDRVAVERFKREYETAKDINSPYVVRVIDFGDTGDNSYFLTMEFLEGEELEALVRREGGLPTARVLRILCQIALGLDEAHASGVIHRDLKPANLFLCQTPEGDSIRVLDFGSVKLQMETGAKLTAFGTTLGSPFYMSPEQAMGKSDVDTRTDLLALGAITYEMFTGKIAFDGAAVAEILMKIVNAMPPTLSSVVRTLPPSLDDVIEKSLAKDKTQRHGGTIEFAADVLTCLGLDAKPDHASIESWGKKPIAEIEAALATATPRAAKPFTAPAPATALSPSATPTYVPAQPMPAPMHVTNTSGGIPVWVYVVIALALFGLACGALGLMFVL